MALLPGEHIDFTTVVTPPVTATGPDDINDKYVRGDVRIVTEQARYPLNTIVTMLSSGDYRLDPEFQRRRRWNRTKQSRLIESFIMNVPIPPIFLYEVSYSRYEVMDGLQRLTAISDFYEGKYRLAGLDQWPELNGMDYHGLPEQVRRGIDRRYLSSIILLQETARDASEAQRLKQLVFDRINSGGEKLEPQESRNALHNGPLNQLCIGLARTPSFCRMWGIPTDEDLISDQLPLPVSEDDEQDGASLGPLHDDALYKKMQDVELVLRFFAYRQLESVEQGRLRDFLDMFLAHGNQFDPQLLEKYRRLFRETSNLVYSVLGDRAFYLYRRRRDGQWTWFERPTKVLYDPIMHAFSLRILDSQVLNAQAERIRAGLKRTYQENADAFEGRSTNQEDIFRRMTLMREFLGQFV